MPKESLPAPIDILFDVPLYQEIEVTENDIENVAHLITYDESIDAFCSNCNENTVFRRVIGEKWAAYANRAQQYISIQKTLGQSVIDDCEFEIIYRCARNEQHKIVFYFVIKEHKLIKVGQYPSLVDFSSNDLKQYRRILDEKIYFEFRRAIGLSAHGVGVGAFVYLRRVFERLVEEIHKQKLNLSEWNEDEYQRSKMDERINLLKNDLPSSLVEQKALWPILSKGIHELSEEECLKYFPMLKNAVEKILLQEIERKREAGEKREQEQQKQEIARIKSELA